MSFLCFWCTCCSVSLFSVVSTSAIDCLERLVFEIRYDTMRRFLKCVWKPTRSRLSLTHHANKSSRWAEKALSGQIVCGISPVGDEKVWRIGYVKEPEWKIKEVKLRVVIVKLISSCVLGGKIKVKATVSGDAREVRRGVHSIDKMKHDQKSDWFVIFKEERVDRRATVT